MRVLLDTCALLWLVGDPARFSARARAALESTETEAYVSAISGFEISVKHRKGKLELPLAPREWLAQAFAAYRGARAESRRAAQLGPHHLTTPNAF